ncbi:hypothetical protein JCM18899A_38080 [Nocardioides sp. AN3]
MSQDIDETSRLGNPGLGQDGPQGPRAAPEMLDTPVGLGVSGPGPRMAWPAPTRPSSTRYDSWLHHIGISRTYTGTYVLLLAEDLDIRIVDTATGELLRSTPSIPQDASTGQHQKRTADLRLRRSAVRDVLRHHIRGGEVVAGEGFAPSKLQRRIRRRSKEIPR